MSILISHNLTSLRALSQVFFGVLEGLFAKDRYTLIEVFHGENDSWSTRQSVDLRATISQTGEELLNEANFVYDIQMT